MGRVRLDTLLVERGVVRSRAEAAEAIAAGLVLVNGSVAQKPARQVDPGEPLHVVPSGPTYVSRGGKKLARALDRFAIDPTGRTAVDAGSATGGFTDCLLQAGAVGVVAVDVGYGQLHEHLRIDERVVSLERTNIREIDRARAIALLEPLPPPSIVVADLSFMSARLICARLLEMSGADGDTVILCKPQFEVGRQVAAKGRGVIRQRSDRSQALEGLIGALTAADAEVRGVISSPILGPAGNAEFLIHARMGAPTASSAVAIMISLALDEAEQL